MPDLYSTLGVPKDADLAAIKKAYRQRAKETHPDLHNGDDAGFQAVSLAYRILSDGKARERYDQTGTIEDGPDNSFAMVMQIINAKIDELLQRADVTTIPVIEYCRESLVSDVRRAKQERSRADDVSLRLTKTRAKLKFKGKGENFIDRSMAVRQAQLEQAMAAMSERITMLERALDVLKDYDFELDVRPGAGMRTGNLYWPNGGGQ